MPINIAHNGAVSDRSKRFGPGLVTFTFDSVSIIAEGTGGALDLGLGAGVPVTIADGETLGVDNHLGTSTATNAVSIAALGGPGAGYIFFTFTMTADGGRGSKRSDNNKVFSIIEINEHQGNAPAAVLFHMTGQGNPQNPLIGQDFSGIGGEMRHDIGMFQQETFGNNYSSRFPRPGGSSLNRTGLQTSFGHRDFFTIFCDAISEEGASDATGIFRFERGTLVVSDPFSGKEFVVENSFEFNIKVVP